MNLDARRRLLARYRSRLSTIFVVYILVWLTLTAVNRSTVRVQPCTDVSRDEFVNIQQLLTNDDCMTQDWNQGLMSCRHIRRPRADAVNIRNDRWQFDKTLGNAVEVIVYSAYYDDRPILGHQAWVRILGVAKLKERQTEVFCQLWYDGLLSPYVTRAVLLKTGRAHGYRFNRSSYVQYLVSCQLPWHKPVPSHVTLAADGRCADSGIYLPIQRPFSGFGFEHEFGACVAIAFGTVPVPEFVEWVELNRLFGVTEFNIYDAGMRNMTDIFEYYARIGILRVHRMPPAVHDVTMDGVKLSSPASLNDCMLRNMYRYRFVVVIDFDEHIVPKLDDTYRDMMVRIDADNRLPVPFHTYTFRNAYFFLDLLPDMTHSSSLRSAIYRKRVEYSRKGFSPKSFVDPRQCLSVFNHYCYHRLVQTGPAYLDVNSSIAACHHYRKCKLANNGCRNIANESMIDDTAIRFKDRLQLAVEQVLRDSYL